MFKAKIKALYRVKLLSILWLTILTPPVIYASDSKDQKVAEQGEEVLELPEGSRTDNASSTPPDSNEKMNQTSNSSDNALIKNIDENKHNANKKGSGLIWFGAVFIGLLVLIFLFT